VICFVFGFMVVGSVLLCLCACAFVKCSVICVLFMLRKKEIRVFVFVDTNSLQHRPQHIDGAFLE
jgi:hypothetical protein